jgi:CRISPR-associated protein Cmr5
MGRQKGRNKGRKKKHQSQPSRATAAPANTSAQARTGSAATPAGNQTEVQSAENRSQAQKRAEHALNKVKELADGNADYGNYASYVKALPARIIMNGLGQALAMEKAASSKDKGHEQLFGHMQDWLLDGWEHSPYRGRPDLLQALVCGSEANYIRAQGEAMAYLQWLKKFSAAFLKDADNDEGGGDGQTAD